MFTRQNVSFFRLTAVAFLACLVWTTASSQTPQQTRPQSRDDVVRVFTELVQTDVMVFDKDGRFVNGLTKDNFTLRVDGKPRPIQSFEQITAGSDEEAQLAAARGSSTIGPKRPLPLDRGRTVFFYVDDFHMDPAGFQATKKVIQTFIDKEMGQNDQAAIATATGQIGFLQQLTTDRTVLHLALDRLTVRSYPIRDFDSPPMSEYEALLIDRLDRDVLDFFVSETMRMNPGITRDQAAGTVRSRSQSLLAQANNFNLNTLLGLERLVKTARNLPGRKLLFFLSGGFLLENRRGDSQAKLRDVTSAAAKSGVVIYSMDTRGLVATLNDASSQKAFDPSGRLEHATRGELFATQDGLNALAADTGGKALFNTNELRQGLTPAMKETSVYYLLAWQPDLEQKQGRFRTIDVSVAGRPDLTIRVRKGFFDLDPKPPTINKDEKPKEDTKSIIGKLREAITASYPTNGLPIALGVDFYDVADKGATVSTSIYLPGEFLNFTEQPDKKIQAIVDVSGVYYDDKGVPKGSFMERLVTTAPSLEATREYHNDLIYTYPGRLPPGLYQVRVAAREDKTGRVGSAYSWIEVPDLAKGTLAMSSLLLGERTPSMIASVSNEDAAAPVTLSATHRFRRVSTLRLLLFAYNTGRATPDQKPDVAVQVQVVRDDQPVITTALRKITTDGVNDLSRLPYAAEIPLAELLPGSYRLLVTIIDRTTKQSASRQTKFEIY